MKALISGQAAIAVICDRRPELHTLDGVAAKAWHSADILRVFDGCADVKEVSVAVVEEIDTLLRTAWAADRALKLFLLLLDPAEPDGELAEYAACVEELLVERDVLGRLEDRLLSSALPGLVEIVQVKEACAASPTVLALIRRLLKLQPIIRRVRNAFDVLPTAQFGTEQEKVACRERLTDEGAFREVVSTLARGENISSFRRQLVNRHHCFSAAMSQWIAYLQPGSAKVPTILSDTVELAPVVKTGITSSARKPTLSRHLRDARIRRGMSVAEVAEQAGVSVASIYLWETGRTHPRDTNLSALCKVLRLPIRAVKAIADD